jgi:hypothetical protein
MTPPVRFSFRQRLAFLLGFAFRDLFEKRARRTTLVCILTVGVLTALATVLLVLPQTNEQVRLRKLRQTPLALCLWVNDGPVGRKITSDLLAKLREQVASTYPFHETEFDWLVQAGGRERGSVALRGRTLASGDPLLESVPLQSGKRFESPDQAGAIVTPEFLRLVLLPAETLPGTMLHIRSRSSGAAVAVPLVAVTADKLPLGHHFLLTEACELALLSSDPDVAVQTVRTGPIPETWPRPRQLPATVREALRAFRLDLPVREERLGKPHVWQISSLSDLPPRCSQWRTYLKRINELMKEAGFTPGPEFDRIETPPVQVHLPERGGYDMAGVYVHDLPDLRPAADGIRAATGLHVVNDGVIQQLNEYAAAARVELVVLLLVLLVVVVLAALNLVVVQELRTQQKIAEIGLLRAVGMNDRLLRGLCQLEAALLWLLGVGGGLLVSVLVLSIGVRQTLSDTERAALFTQQWLLLETAFLALSALICSGSAWFATRSARRACPAESLRKQ